MPSNSIPLNNFTYPIPICQPEADLGSILNIFQRSHCKLLAVPQYKDKWGIINSEDLLSLMSQAWLGKKPALVGHPKNLPDFLSFPRITIQDFNSLIKPAIVYSSDTELDEFLSSLQSDSLFDDLEEYLIVTATGKLQGRLDRHKILQYLISKSARNSADFYSMPSYWSSFSNLIEAIPFPIEIETASGKTICSNKCWQELIFDPRAGQNSSITECDINIDGLQQQLSQNERDLPASAAELSSNSLNSSKLTREKLAGWNFVRVPLSSSAEEILENADSHYLVWATKVAPARADSSVPNSSTANEPINTLLTTIGHELKSPLTGIVGLSNLLGEDKLGQLNQRQSSYVSLIHRSGQKMMGIIDNLLKLNSLATKQLPTESIDLESLCRQLYQQVLTKIQSEEVETDFVPRASEPKLVIELGSEIAIASKPILSKILFHLMLETFQVNKSLDRLEVSIGNLQELTTITVGNNLGDGATTLSTEKTESSSATSGLDLAIARYLAQTIDVTVNCLVRSDRCQLTLLLPKAVTSSLSSNPTVTDGDRTTRRNLTILCLYPEPEAIDLLVSSKSKSFDLKSWSDNSQQQVDRQYRIIEADSLEQAHTLARIWELDVVVLDGYRIIEPVTYLQSLRESEYLAALPLITLDARTTEAANQIEGLNIYPCLLPAEHRSVEDLMQVIQIATEA